MQHDGNLVHYDGRGGLCYSWNTYTNVNAYAILQGDGNLVVRTQAGAAIKASLSNTSC